MRQPGPIIRACDPIAELHGLQFVTTKSPHLRGRGDISLWVPHAEGTSLPLLILLHGVYGSHWSWPISGEAHLTAQRMTAAGAIRPLLLAMPSDGLFGDGSMYAGHQDGRDYERWILEDVPQAVAAVLPQGITISATAIAGLSMGGFGALRLGAKHGRERYFAVSAHSSCTHLQDVEQFIEEPLSLLGIAPQDQSVLDTMLQRRTDLPPLRFDCGCDDFLLPQNRALHTAMLNADIPHIYEEYPGDHSWPYWKAHLAETLLFVDRHRPDQPDVRRS